MEIDEKTLTTLREMLAIQGEDGSWNYDMYSHGLYNGMELMLATIEQREPVFRKTPSEWLCSRTPGEIDDPIGTSG